jgi:hypothetical protein
MKDFFTFWSDKLKALAELDFWTQLSTVLGIITFVAGILIWYKKRGNKHIDSLNEIIKTKDIHLEQRGSDIKKLKNEIDEKDFMISELKRKTIESFRENIEKELKYNNEKRAFGIAVDYLKLSSTFFAECSWISSKLEFSKLISEWWHTSIKQNPGSEEDVHSVELAVIDSSLKLDKILSLAETAKLIIPKEKRFESWESGIRLIHTLCTEYISTNKIKIFALSEERSSRLGFNLNNNVYHAFGILNTLREALIENQILVQIELCKELYEFKSRVFGPDNPTTIMEKSNLGVLTAKTGNYHEAIKIIDDTLKNLRKSLKDDHEYVSIVKSNLEDIQNKIKMNETA